MRSVSFITALLIFPLLVGWFKRTQPTDLQLIQGTWMTGEADERRVWYFDKDGKGRLQTRQDHVVRTQTFQYTLEDQRLDVVLNARGDRHSARFDVSDHQLALAGDALFESARPYTRVKSTRIEPHMFGNYAFTSKDGSFHEIQLLARRLDGTGQGWYHQGTKDDWQTEVLDYRSDRRLIQLRFPHRDALAHLVLEHKGVEALYQQQEATLPCAYVYTRSRFSRWLNSVPQPAPPHAGTGVDGPHQAACRSQTR
ncbi:MAG: DUF5640 domain-containing protein [Myxococcota bacterium]